jgi:hydrogenase maturation protease
MTTEHMPRVLIVAYGNPLRSDDGVAWRAADQLDGMFPRPDVEILRLHQLAPELAETVSRFAAVIFVDAAEANGAPGEVRCEEIVLSAASTRFSHQLSPQAVLSLAAQLYQARPRVFRATLAGQSFEHGEALSPAVLAALPSLVAQIEALVQRLCSANGG